MSKHVLLTDLAAGAALIGAGYLQARNETDQEQDEKDDKEDFGDGGGQTRK